MRKSRMFQLFVLVALVWVAFKLGQEVARRFRVANATFEKRIAEAAKSGGIYVGEALEFRRTFFRKRLYARSQGKPIVLKPSSLAFVGDPSSGKSVLLTAILAQIILSSPSNSGARGPAILIIDCNGADSYLPRILEHLCKEAGWTFKFWAGEGASHLWYPLVDLRKTAPNPAAFGETLALSTEAGVGHEHNFWLGRAMRFGARMAECHPEALTFEEMRRHAEDPDDDIWVDRNQAEQSTGITDPIALLASVRSLNAARPTEEQLRNGIHLPEDIRRGRTLVLFRFNRNHSLAKATLRIIRDSGKYVNEGRRNKSEFILAVDEAPRIANAAIVDELLGIGRHCGMRQFIPIFQGYAQLREDLQQTMLTLNTVFFGSTDGGYTRKKFLDESTTEDFGLTPDGRQSYLTYPTLRHEHLEFLSSPEAKNTFLLRVRGDYAFAKALYPVSFQTYCELQDKGFPKVGELPGMIDQTSHFYLLSASAQPSPTEFSVGT